MPGAEIAEKVEVRKPYVYRPVNNKARTAVAEFRHLAAKQKRTLERRRRLTV